MRNIIRYAAALILCAIVAGYSGTASAQKKKVVSITAKMEIVDEVGNPVRGASVSSAQERYEYVAGLDGKLTIKVKVTDHLKVKAPGYEPRLIPAADLRNGKSVVTLVGRPERMDDAHQLVTVTGDRISERRTVGAFSTVSGADLEKNPTMFLYDALGGRLNTQITRNNAIVSGCIN